MLAKAATTGFVPYAASPAMRLLAILCALFAVTLGVGDAGPARGQTPMPSNAARAGTAAVEATLDQVQFVPNRGQWAEAVRFAAIGDSMAWLHDDGYTLRFERWSAPRPDDRRTPREQSGCVVRTRFLAAQSPTFEPQTQLATQRHFFVGNDRRRWQSGVPSYERVIARGVYAGIDVVFRPLPAERRGPFEYDLLLAPGADLARFAAQCEGVDELRIDAAGRLCAKIAAAAGDYELVQEAPVAWQCTPNGQRPLPVAFRLLDAKTYGFVAADLDPRWQAVVDPGVVWGTFLGGGLTDSVNALRWREGVGVWCAGWASSTDFPTTPGAYRTTGGADAFVARLNDAGTTLQFSTYLGGLRAEEVRGLDLGPGDTPTVVGYTQSPNFPVTPAALQPTYGGASLFLDVGDGFLTRLSAAGDQLLSSTYLGGLYDDVAEDVVVDPTGVATVAGWTSSPNFPVTPGVFQPVLAGVPGVTTDGFITRVAANAQSLVFSTYVGGFFNDQFVAIDRDPVSNQPVACGWTFATDYPTTPNVVRPAPSGAADGIVTRLSSNGATATFSTYLGGLDQDFALCVNAAPDGTIWVGGTTASSNFPVTLNVPQGSKSGGTDGFVTQLSANGQTLVFSTFLGSPSGDKVRGIDVSTAGIAVVGEAGAGFPVTLDAVQGVHSGGNLDAFLTFLTNGGSTITYSTYLGGTNQDVLDCVTLSNSGIAVVGGFTFSADFPIAPASYQPLLRGVEDGVVLKFDLVTSFGDSLIVTSDPVDAAARVQEGEHELLAVSLQNVTARELVLDAVNVLVAGAGDAPSRLTALRIYRDEVGSTASPTLVAGPLLVLVDNRETAVLLSGCTIPANGTVRLRLVGDLLADPSGASAEIALTIASTNSWNLRAVGSGAGPDVRVAAPGRADGRVLVIGELPGDMDRDGTRTVVDLRRQIVQLGSIERAADVDGDGAITMVDMQATRQALLGRATIFTTPALIPRGAWFTLAGLFPDWRSATVTLGGQALALGSATPRELTFFVPPTQLVGTQELTVSNVGRLALASLVQVQ